MKTKFSFHLFAHHQFISSVSYSFQCIVLFLPWLNLFSGYFILFDAFLNKIAFYFLSGSLLVVCRNAIDILYINFLSWNFTELIY